MRLKVTNGTLRMILLKAVEDAGEMDLGRRLSKVSHVCPRKRRLPVHATLLNLQHVIICALPFLVTGYSDHSLGGKPIPGK